MPRHMGEITIADPGSDKMIHREGTYLCCHCGGHFTLRPGSGRLRGFCTRCHGPFCGPRCEPCIPTEQMLENIEAGRHPAHRETKVWVPRQIQE